MAKKKINIFYAIADSSLTGAPRHVLSLVKNLNMKDFTVSVILPQGPLADELKKLKINTFLVPMKHRADMGAVNRIKKLLRKYDPDILHVHGSRAGLFARMAAKGLPIKIVYTEHTRALQFRLNNPVLDWSHIKARAMLDKWTTVNIAVSNAVKEFLVKYKITRPDKIRVIYNGISSKPNKYIDTDTIDIITQYGLKKRDVIIGTIGSLNIQKDTITLVKAMPRVFKKIPTAKLVLVGSGPLKYMLQKIVKKLKISDKVIFTGTVKDISSILQLLTVFILPSRSEAFGISILEAMRANVPVIATRVGGIPEVITNNQNGILIDPGNHKLLSSTIIRLLHNNKLQHKLIKNGTETVKRFSITKMVNETSQLYRTILKK